ncbi:multicopper oxidase domain-containing protein [Streptomyces sp. NPDC057411]|uniref:multicopper oxidase domain-containing protein n=1 Tax=unclassified Streptomyces TaxID=2593676 RepID=UPI00362C84DF
MISRRNVLKAGVATSAVGAAGLLIPAAGGTAQAADLDPAGIPKFTQPMTVPPTLAPYSSTGTADYYAMTMKEADVEILPGRLTRVRTFNGSFPGPVIRARSGVRTVVQQTNNLPVATSVHLHGAHVPPDSDGGPMDLIAANGGTKTYTYPNSQPHANLWYHDHAHHAESENVFRGLAGTYLLTDDVEKSNSLPTGAYDVPIQLRDARFDDQGQLVYAMDDFLNRNVILANGKAWPYFDVSHRQYRFRIYNTANMRYFKLSLTGGLPFTLIGTDGGLLEKPQEVSTLELSPGERADVLIDFFEYPRGSKVELVNAADAMPGGPADQITKVLQFRVGLTGAQDFGSVPYQMRTLPALPPATVNRSVVLSMDETGQSTDVGYLNGLSYDMDRIDTEIVYGTTEIWTVTNANKIIPHNFHIHLVQFRVLERNGKPVTSGPETGLKDTVNLNPGETVKLQATFTGYRGTYLYHCHIFDHAAMGMMANMKIV